MSNKAELKKQDREMQTALSQSLRERETENSDFGERKHSIGFRMAISRTRKKVAWEAQRALGV